MSPPPLSSASERGRDAARLADSEALRAPHRCARRRARSRASRAELAIHIWLLVVLALASLSLLQGVNTAYPSGDSPFLASLRRPSISAERPASLARTEREVSMAGAAAFDVHFRLRPVLIELAADLLSTRRGIDLERNPEQAHAALGDETWEIVRPDRPEPAQRNAPGLDEAHLDRIVTALEQV